MVNMATTRVHIRATFLESLDSVEHPEAPSIGPTCCVQMRINRYVRTTHSRL